MHQKSVRHDTAVKRLSMRETLRGDRRTDRSRLQSRSQSLRSPCPAERETRDSGIKRFG